METLSIKDVQTKLTEMLKWYHEYCIANKLRYYAIGGTMLGAARHKGFIPWDDDLDIGMPRPDYEKFLTLLEKKIVDGYTAESIGSNRKDFVYPFAKLYDTRTTLVEHARTPIKRGLYIDIYPLDGCGDSKEDALLHFKRIGKMLNLLSARVCGIRPGRAIYKNAAIVAMRIAEPFMPDLHKFMEKLNKSCQWADFDQSTFAGNLYGLKRAEEIMPKKYFGTPKLYDFENIQVYGVEMYDEFLTQIYGDWRKLPPVEKQITHHDYISCDLNTPYIAGSEGNRL